jgi:hypothetical protein
MTSPPLLLQKIGPYNEIDVSSLILKCQKGDVFAVSGRSLIVTNPQPRAKRPSSYKFRTLAAMSRSACSVCATVRANGVQASILCGDNQPPITAPRRQV